MHLCLASFTGGKKPKKRKRPCCILYTSFLLTFICNTMKKHLSKPQWPAFLKLGQPPPATYNKKALLLLPPLPLAPLNSFHPVSASRTNPAPREGKGREGDPLCPGSGRLPLCSAAPAPADPVSHNLPWQTRPCSPDGLRARQRGTAPDSNPSRQIEGTRPWCKRRRRAGEGEGARVGRREVRDPWGCVGTVPSLWGCWRCWGW